MSVITFMKHIKRIAVIIISVAILTGCLVSVAPEEQEKTMPVATHILSPNPTERVKAEPTLADSSSSAVQVKASVDFDGDGLEDTVLAERTPDSHSNLDPSQWRATLTVELGNGEKLVQEIPGWWWSADSHTADFDADGKTDIALIMGVGGSNYNATSVFVYRVVDGRIVEYPKNIIINEAIPYDQSAFSVLNSDNGPWVGGTVIEEDAGPMLRVRQMLDYDPGQGITTAYYTNLLWNGEGWFIESMEVGEAFGEEKPITPDAPQ